MIDQILLGGQCNAQLSNHFHILRISTNMKNLIWLITLFLIAGIGMVACEQETDTHKASESTIINKTPSAPKEIAEFWSAFKKAVESENYQTILELSTIPFTTRGSMDDDPLIALDQTAFLANINAILSTDPGITTTPTTQAKLVSQTKILEDKGGGFVRVGDLVFNKVNGQWKFTRAYIDADQLTVLPGTIKKD